VSELAPEIDIETFAASQDDGLTVDVREPMEYVQAHVPGAVLMPMGQLPSRMAELEKNTPVFVICASGQRSLVMAEVLNRAGYDATSVAGGTIAWAQSGRPIETGWGDARAPRPRGDGGTSS
jgi:rhodanese-related sulfurtransferase